MKKTLLKLFATIALLSGFSFAQVNYLPPTVISGNATTGLIVTAGTVNNGGHPVAVAAVAVGTLTVALNKTDCSAPAFALCNFVVANSSGTVSVTSSLATANAAGNTILALIETGGVTITQIVYPWQASVAYMGAAYGQGTAFSCGAALAANGACANTAQAAPFHIIFGTAVLASNTSTITGISPAFTSSTSFFCVANDITTRANPVQAVPASGSTVTFTNTTGATDTIQYICAGN